MERYAADPSPPGRGKAAATPGRGEHGDAQLHAERYGPVSLARQKKDDGRALILYRRSDTPRS